MTYPLIRTVLLALGAAHTVSACLPTGPSAYDGPTYDVTDTITSADGGSGLRQADAGVVAPESDGGPLPANDAGHVDAASADAGGSVGGTDASTTSGTDDAGPIDGALTSCTFKATTVAPSGTYNPRYITAIWVENSAGKLVRTLAYYAGVRARYLSAYVTSRGAATVDVVTGATANIAIDHDVSWDLTSVGGNVVPDGDYRIRVETTSKNGTGPVFNVDFVKGSSAVDVTPPNAGNVSAISLHCQ